MALFIEMLTVLLVTISTIQAQSRCVCENPTCLGLRTGNGRTFVKTIDGGRSIVTDELETEGEIKKFLGVSTGLLEGTPTGSFNPRDTEDERLWKQLRRTEHAGCEWVLGVDGRQNITLRDIPDLVTETGIPTAWRPTMFTAQAGTCYRGPQVFGCSSGFFLSPGGCPPEQCTGEATTVSAIGVTRCRTGYILPHDGLETIIPPESCWTNRGFLAPGVKRVREIPTQTSSRCGIIRRTPSNLPRASGQMGVINSGVDLLRANGATLTHEGRGWYRVTAPGNDQLEKFIRCCGFMLGIGGAIWQYRLNNGGGEDGSASAKEVTEDFNKLIGEINVRLGTLERQILNNQKDIRVLEGGLSGVEEVLTELLLVENVTAEFSSKVVEKFEADLRNRGYCKESKHCWCPPEKPKTTPLAPIPTIDPLEPLNSSKWFNLVIMIVVIGLIILGIALIFYIKRKT